VFVVAAVWMVGAPAGWAESEMDVRAALQHLRQFRSGRTSGGPVLPERCATRYFQKVWSDRHLLSRAEREEAKRYFQRPNVPGGGPFLTVSPLTRTFGTPHFKFWYATTGPDAVPLEDVLPANGVPDYVDVNADVFERAYHFEVEVMGFRRPLSDYWGPDNGGDERYDVYLFSSRGRFFGVTVTEWFDRVLATSLTGSLWFGMESRVYDILGKAEGKRFIETTAAHEFHHACQYAYNARLPVWIAEAAATWMETRAYDAGLVDDGDDYDDPDDPSETSGVDQALGTYGAIRAWFLHPDEALDSSGHAYGNVIFINYLTDRFGQDFVRELYEQLSDGGQREMGNFWDLLSSKGTNWIETFKTFAIWNYFTGERAALLRRGDGVFPGYRDAARYPPIGIHPTDVHKAYPVTALLDEHQMPDAMSARYVVFEPPEGMDAPFAVRVRGANIDEVTLLDFTEGKPDRSFYQKWLENVGLRGWAAPLIVEKANGEIVRDEVFLYPLSQEGQRVFTGFGKDIRRIVLILVNARPDTEERGNFISYSAGPIPRGKLSELNAVAAATGGAELSWRLDDLTDIRQVYVVRKRYSPFNADRDNRPFQDAAEAHHAGDRDGNSLADGSLRIVAALSPTDTRYVDRTVFEDVSTDVAGFDPRQVRYYYAVVPVDRFGIMGSPAIAPGGVSPVPPAAPAFLVSTREPRPGVWLIRVGSTVPLADAPSLVLTRPNGRQDDIPVERVEDDLWEAEFQHRTFPVAGLYRFRVRGVSQSGEWGSWVLSGATYRYAPAALRPRMLILPSRVHRAGDGPIEFYPPGMRVRVYTAAGEFVRELEIDSKWDGRNARGEPVSPGVYFYRADDGEGFQETGRLVLKPW
jgi:hypothetical protein